MATLPKYNTFISNQKWLHCRNTTLSFVQWPKGARDMYLLFLQRTSLNDDAAKTSFNTGNISCDTGKTSRDTRKTSCDNDKTSKLCNSKLINTSPLIGTTPVKRKLCNMFESTPLGKKTCTTTTKDCVVTGFDMPVVRTEWPEYRYNPVDEEWQHNACTQLGLTFVRPFTRVSGGM